MKLLFALAFFLHMTGAEAAHHLPLARRTSMMQGSVSEPTQAPMDHVWKLSLLGLAGIGFLIRKRL